MTLRELSDFLSQNQLKNVENGYKSLGFSCNCDNRIIINALQGYLKEPSNRIIDPIETVASDICPGNIKHRCKPGVAQHLQLNIAIR